MDLTPSAGGGPTVAVSSSYAARTVGNVTTYVIDCSVSVSCDETWSMTWNCCDSANDSSVGSACSSRNKTNQGKSVTFVRVLDLIGITINPSIEQAACDAVSLDAAAICDAFEEGPEAIGDVFVDDDMGVVGITPPSGFYSDESQFSCYALEHPPTSGSGSGSAE